MRMRGVGLGFGVGLGLGNSEMRRRAPCREECESSAGWMNIEIDGAHSKEESKF